MRDLLRTVASGIERHLGLVLLATFALGLAVPSLAQVPPEAVLASLSAIIFLSCFRVQPGELKDLRVLHLALFTGWRFVLLPVVLFGAATLVMPEHRVGILLIALMPAGVSSPALAALLGGRVSLALALLIVSTVLAPFSVPFVLGAVTDDSAQLDRWQIFKTLALTVLVPIALHLPFRAMPTAGALARRSLGWSSVLVIGLAIAVVFAKQRDVVLADPLSLLPGLATAFLVYGVFYLAGWAVPGGTPERRSLMVGSGANNVVLGISIGLAHFDPEVALFLVLCEVPWILFLIPARRLARA